MTSTPPQIALDALNPELREVQIEDFARNIEANRGYSISEVKARELAEEKFAYFSGVVEELFKLNGWENPFESGEK